MKRNNKKTLVIEKRLLYSLVFDTVTWGFDDDDDDDDKVDINVVGSNEFGFFFFFRVFVHVLGFSVSVSVLDLKEDLVLLLLLERLFLKNPKQQNIVSPNHTDTCNLMSRNFQYFFKADPTRP